MLQQISVIHTGSCYLVHSKVFHGAVERDIVADPGGKIAQLLMRESRVGRWIWKTTQSLNVSFEIIETNACLSYAENQTTVLITFNYKSMICKWSEATWGRLNKENVDCIFKTLQCLG